MISIMTWLTMFATLYGCVLLGWNVQMTQSMPTVTVVETKKVTMKPPTYTFRIRTTPFRSSFS